MCLIDKDMVMPMGERQWNKIIVPFSFNFFTSVPDPAETFRYTCGHAHLYHSSKGWIWSKDWVNSILKSRVEKEKEVIQGYDDDMDRNIK